MKIADLLRPLRLSILNLVARAVVKQVDDSTRLQLLQLVVGEDTRGEVERFQNYGFTSRPANGAEAVVAFVGGDRAHGLALAVEDRRYRIRNLSNGEVVVYDLTGTTVLLKQNGDIEITPSSGTVKVTGDLNVTGTVTGTVDVVGGGKSLKTHVHTPGSFSNGGGPVGGTSGAPL